MEQHGRARALELLKGRRVMCDALSHGESVATRRDLGVVVPLVPGGPKKRKRAPRPGRPTNWPTTKAERDRVAARTLELQAHPDRRTKRTDQAGTEHIRLAAAGASNGAAYHPTEEEVGPLSELTLRVAEAAGVDVREMTTPYAEATCVDGEAGWVRNTDGTSKWRDREPHGRHGVARILFYTRQSHHTRALGGGGGAPIQHRR